MPHTVTIEKTVFAFDELSDRAKETARDWWRRCENEDSDNSCVFDDVVECGAILGIEIATRQVKLMGGGTRQEPTIYYSGFSSQGDGACFEGRYAYAKGATKKIRRHAQQDTVLHRIADDLQALQRPTMYRLGATMRHSGHYYHSGCMAVDVYNVNNDDIAFGGADEIIQLMRDFADWIYRQLEAEYDYRTSDENVDDSIRANEYEFTESGEIA